MNASYVNAAYMFNQEGFNPDLWYYKICKSLSWDIESPKMVFSGLGSLDEPLKLEPSKVPQIGANVSIINAEVIINGMELDRAIVMGKVIAIHYFIDFTSAHPADDINLILIEPSNIIMYRKDEKDYFDYLAGKVYEG